MVLVNDKRNKFYCVVYRFFGHKGRESVEESRCLLFDSMSDKDSTWSQSDVTEREYTDNRVIGRKEGRVE